MSKKLEFDAQLRPSSKKYIPKAALRSQKCKWKQGGKNEEVFFTASASVTKFIPGANDSLPVGFFDLQMGTYNKMKINTRDFVELAKAINQLNEWFQNNAAALQSSMDDQLTRYTEHKYKELAYLRDMGIGVPTAPAVDSPNEK